MPSTLSVYDRVIQLLGLDEPRHEERTACNLTALCACITLPALNWADAHVLDISSEGLCLLTETWADPGQFLAVLFPRPESSQAPPALMKVIHVHYCAPQCFQIGGLWIRKQSPNQLQGLLETCAETPSEAIAAL
jgi:hypothetical protein